MLESKPDSTSKRPPPGFWLVLVVTFGGVSVQYAYWHLELTTPFVGSTPGELVAGTGSTPFQYRILVPLLLRGLLSVFGPGSLPLLAMLGEALFFSAFLGVIFLWLRELRWSHTQALAFALLGSGVPLFVYVLPRLKPFFMLYDTATLAFFTALFALLTKRSWALYYPLFMIATLNRETTFLLTGAMILGMWGRERFRTIAIHAGAQTMIWAALKIALWIVFRPNRGAGLVELHHVGAAGSHLASNLEFLLTPTVALPALISVVAAIWLPGLVFGKAIADVTLRRAWWLLPAWFAVMMAVGNIYELRVFGEFSGLAIISVAQILRPPRELA